MGGGGGCGFDEETISEGGFEVRVMTWWEVERRRECCFSRQVDDYCCDSSTCIVGIETSPLRSRAHGPM